MERARGRKYRTRLLAATGTLLASSSIKNAAGRTTDGSGSVTRIHRAADSSFVCLFRVTDAMKPASHNPTRVDMRLAADCASGGELQDLICVDLSLLTAPGMAAPSPKVPLMVR